MGRVDAREALRESRPPKTEFGVRYTQFLGSGLGRNIIELVAFNVVAHQQSEGLVRTNRPVPEKRENMKRQYFENRESILMANESDEKILNQLAAFKEENSLDMGGEAQKWFDYVVGVEGTD